jgi:hypothetical protein
MIPRWLVRAAVVVPGLLLFALAVRELPVLAVLVAVIGGLSGLTYLVRRSRGPMPEPNPATRDVERDIPPNPG